MEWHILLLKYDFIISISEIITVTQHEWFAENIRRNSILRLFATYHTTNWIFTDSMALKIKLFIWGFLCKQNNNYLNYDGTINSQVNKLTKQSKSQYLIHYVIYGQAQNNWILCTIKYSMGYDISVVLD